eukprot:15475607-Alexandrium_andersonii.AAC.1
MHIRAPEAPREARRLRRPPPKSGAPTFAGSEPGEGRLDRSASWDCDLPGGVWSESPTSTG